MAKVGVLGLGAMGSRMARNLLKAEHDVTVWNRSPAACLPLAEAGAKVAQTPRSAVAEADFAIAMVRDDAASEAVWLDRDFGALAGLRRGALGIESSTLTIGWVRALADRFRAADAGFLDAPVVGSRPQADAAQLVYLVGGDAEALAAAEPVLRAMAGAVHHAGVAGDGAALKLAINALFGIQVAALAEILGLLGRSGLDLARAVEILGSTAVCSPAAKAAAASMLSGAFPPLFPAELVEKDLGYALETAAVAAMPMTSAGRAVFAEARRQGFGRDNLTGVVRLYR